MKGACHCGQVTLRVPGRPDYLNSCNCSQCWQRGALWGYFPFSQVEIAGPTIAYARADIEVHLTNDFCPHCGVTTNWAPARPGMADRMGVNMRLFDPERLIGIEVRYINGRGDTDDERRQHYREPTVFDGAGTSA